MSSLFGNSLLWLSHTNHLSSNDASLHWNRSRLHSFIQSINQSQAATEGIRPAILVSPQSHADKSGEGADSNAVRARSFPSFSYDRIGWPFPGRWSSYSVVYVIAYCGLWILFYCPRSDNAMGIMHTHVWMLQPTPQNRSLTHFDLSLTNKLIYPPL